MDYVRSYHKHAVIQAVPSPTHNVALLKLFCKYPGTPGRYNRYFQVSADFEGENPIYDVGHGTLWG